MVLHRREVRRPLLLAVVDNFLYGYLVVALVLVVDQAGAGPAWLGWLNAALTAGALGVMPLVARLVGGRAVSVLPLTLTAFCLATATLGLVGAHFPALVVPAPSLLVVAGATTLVAEVAAVTLLQRSAGREALARVFGIYDQLCIGALALGSLLAGPLAGLWGPGPALALVGAVCAVPAALCLPRRAV